MYSDFRQGDNKITWHFQIYCCIFLLSAKEYRQMLHHKSFWERNARSTVFLCLFFLLLFFSRLGNKLQPHFRRMEMKSWRLGPWGARPPTSTRRWRNFPKRSCNVLGSILINAHWLWRLLFGLLEFAIFVLSCEDALHRFPALLCFLRQTQSSPSTVSFGIRYFVSYGLLSTPGGVQAKWSVGRQGRLFHVKLNKSIFRG